MCIRYSKGHRVSFASKALKIYIVIDLGKYIIKDKKPD